MSEPEHIDDELLSAYLDYELAPVDRARVEARLATDPAARQLLEQLRSVSQAMKSMPTERLGADIRDTVLRRAERAMLLPDAKKSGTPAGGGPLNDLSSRPFTIGRSLRGWIWAGLATAAGLAIVAFQSNSNRDAGLPDTVARHESKSAQSDRVVERDTELRAIVKSEKQDGPAIASAPSSAPAATIAPSAESSTPMPLAPPAAADLAVDKAAPRGEPDRYAASAASGGAVAGRREVENSSATPSAAGEAESGNADMGLLVVHVEVAPDAYRNRAFDGVLARNDIVMEQSAEADNKSSVALNDLAKDTTSKTPAEAPARTNSAINPQPTVGVLSQVKKESKPTAPETTDLVLVDAPASQIRSCLEDLRRDEHNYPAVAVDEDQIANERFAAAGRQNSQLGREDWSQYNRGIVSQKQKLQRGADNSLYYSTDEGTVSLDRSDDRAGGGPAQQNFSFDSGTRSLSENRSRAMRMSSQAVPALQQNAPAQRLDSSRAATSARGGSALGTASHAANEPVKEREALAPQSTGNVQVLFVLQPSSEAPPVSPPPNEKAAK
jgi:anti-sigma factor RsiW